MKKKLVYKPILNQAEYNMIKDDELFDCVLDEVKLERKVNTVLEYANKGIQQYYEYAKELYNSWDFSINFENAWDLMKNVDKTEIEKGNEGGVPLGKAQYPMPGLMYYGAIIPYGTTKVGVKSFYQMGAPNPVVFPNTITTFEESSFEGWGGQTFGLVLPEGVERVEEKAFKGWQTLNKEIKLPSTLKYIGKEAFSTYGAYNQRTVIPDSVVEMGEEAFSTRPYNNGELIIGKGLTVLEKGVFKNWIVHNTQIEIPENIIEIGETAFENFPENENPIIIPASVEKIGSKAFNFWVLVPYVYIKRETPPELLNIDAFGNQDDAPIYVPHNSVELYKQAPVWEDLKERIFSINDLIE